MIFSDSTNVFTDEYRKNILDDGSIDSGVLQFSRPYSFSLTSNYSLTSKNIFTHIFDKSIYPSTIGTATGFSVFATATNSFSGYYYTTLMQLYNRRVVETVDGTFSTTTLTSSSTSSFSSIDKFNPYMQDNEFNNISMSSFSASITGFYIYCFSREIYGDMIHDGTLQLFLSGATSSLAYDTYSFNNSIIYSLSSSYVDSQTAVTRFWSLPDNGKVVVWSSNNTINNSLTSITQVNFRNSLSIANRTLNIHVEPHEFNSTNNFSYYANEYQTGRVPETWITSVGLYNPWGDLLAVLKLQKPIKKGNVPITIKAILDLI